MLVCVRLGKTPSPAMHVSGQHLNRLRRRRTGASSALESKGSGSQIRRCCPQPELSCLMSYNTFCLPASSIAACCCLPCTTRPLYEQVLDACCFRAGGATWPRPGSLRLAVRQSLAVLRACKGLGGGVRWPWQLQSITGVTMVTRPEATSAFEAVH